jgi:hypothetical protein
MTGCVHPANDEGPALSQTRGLRWPGEWTLSEREYGLSPPGSDTLFQLFEFGIEVEFEYIDLLRIHPVVLLDGRVTGSSRPGPCSPTGPAGEP